MTDPMTLIRENPLPFATLLGIEIVEATPERIEARLAVRKELCTRPDVLHGGALMAFADTLGAVGTVLNLPKGATTTTIESKTNFFAAVPMGEQARGVCEPVHRGRTTMVWQTRVYRQDGRLAGQVTQTQLVIQPQKPA
jgi:1,4-dihydroxy-2-naphthoyl-CoA hydrolase